MVKICLCMIIGNEERIIKRCIEHALPAIDAISICVNGSDNSIEIINGYKEKLPTNIAKHSWKNFGHNRTLSFQEAVRFCRDELKWDLTNSYCLFLDADMKLVVGKDFNKEHLKAVGYLIYQFDGLNRYVNLRLARMDIGWTCIKGTHEYWNNPSSEPVQEYPYLEINDIGDGGSKGDKFIRDEKILTEELIENPNDVRNLFYLAQTKNSLGKYRESINLYRRRIELGQMDEEVFYSHFMIAENYKCLGEFDEATKWYLKAYQYRPTRIEPLYYMAKMYRERGNNALGFLFARACLGHPEPRDLLFIQHRIYHYLPHLEISICGYYIGKKKEAMASTEMLLRLNYDDNTVRTNAKNNYKFYINKIITKKIVVLPKLIEQNVMNPSLVQYKEGYLINGRHVNWKVTEQGDYIVTDGSGLVKARNFLYFYDRNYNLKWTKELEDDFSFYDKGQRVLGLEDMRLFTWNDQVYALPNTTLFTGISQIALVKIEPEQGKISKPLHLQFEGINPCEKNWMPFPNIKGEQASAIYSHEPMTLVNFTTDGKTEKIELEPKSTFEFTRVKKDDKSQTRPYTFSDFRGGACVFTSQGVLGLVHDVFFEGKVRTYYHRFVWYDKNMKIIKCSLPFYFLEKGIEYACGMCPSYEGNSVIIGLGVKDREAHLVEVELSQISNLPYFNAIEGSVTV